MPHEPSPTLSSRPADVGFPAPKRLLVTATLLILVSEFLIMWVFETLNLFHKALDALTDTAVLSLAVGPLLYVLLFRPMTLLLRERLNAEEGLRRARDELEDRVADRTQELEAANRSLREEAERIQRADAEIRYQASLLDAVEQAVVGLDPDSRVRYWNRFATELYGWSPEQATGRRLGDIVRPLDERGVAFDPVALSAGRSWAAEIQATRRDGGRFPAFASCAQLRDASGELGGYVFLSMDITERKIAEEALRSSREELRELSARLIGVQEEERARVARELHDGLGQSLSAIQFIAEGALKSSRRDRDRRTALESVIPIVREAIQDVRVIAMDLRPSTLDTLGLLHTIGWWSRQIESAYPGIRVDRDLEVEEGQVPAALKTTIFRILQEATGNAAKHSGATRIRVALERNEAEIRLSVEDNGHGFDLEKTPEVPPGKGFGLTFMKERAELSGGAFFLESAHGSGTVLRACWPLDDRALSG